MGICQEVFYAGNGASLSLCGALGKSDVLGSIQAGKYADIIAVNGDPLTDIRVLEHVSFVMKEGRISKDER